MNLQDLLTSKEINKVVDPEALLDRKDLDGFPEAPKEVKDLQINKDIEITTLLSDLKTKAELTGQEAEDLYNSILMTADQDSEFLEYVDLVERYTWNPMELATNPEARPDTTVDYQRLKDLELDLFQKWLFFLILEGYLVRLTMLNTLPITPGIA
jgi:hypothetical protein